MFVRCPSCSAPHEIPFLQPGFGGELVDCAACGHSWIEGHSVAPMAAPVTSAPAAAPAAPEPDLTRLMDAARLARKAFDGARSQRRRRVAVWAGLALFATAPLIATIAYPEQVVSHLPASIVLYDWLGQNVNIYGLEIRDVDLQHLVVDGKQVIAVKGELSNVSQTVRKIPWLHFGLRSNDNVEVYSWTLDTEVRPLKPGESTSFVTRLASPPEAARKIEIRFAQADEIGSNVVP